MRAFFSISVPPTIGAKLLTLVPPIKALRRTTPNHLHLTLHFLEDAPTSLPSDLSTFPLPRPFTLTPSRYLPLPESGPIRLIAASIKPSEPLTQLHTTLASELTRLSLPVDKRRFLPHITLARANPPLPQHLRAATPMEPREDLSFTASELHLIESRPTDKGFEYHMLRTWKLGMATTGD